MIWCCMVARPVSSGDLGRDCGRLSAMFAGQRGGTGRARWLDDVVRGGVARARAVSDSAACTVRGLAQSHVRRFGQQSAGGGAAGRFAALPGGDPGGSGIPPPLPRGRRGGEVVGSLVPPVASSSWRPALPGTLCGGAGGRWRGCWVGLPLAASRRGIACCDGGLCGRGGQSSASPPTSRRPPARSPRGGPASSPARRTKPGISSRRTASAWHHLLLGFGGILAMCSS